MGILNHKALTLRHHQPLILHPYLNGHVKLDAEELACVCGGHTGDVVGPSGGDRWDGFVVVEVDGAGCNGAGLAFLFEFFADVSRYGLLDDTALNSDLPCAGVEALVERARNDG